MAKSAKFATRYRLHPSPTPRQANTLRIRTQEVIENKASCPETEPEKTRKTPQEAEKTPQIPLANPGIASPGAPTTAKQRPATQWHNPAMKFLFTTLALLTLAGCAKDINNKDAVKSAIMKRVAKTGFDVSAMKVDVTQVSFHDQDAVATVAFLPNGGPPESAVKFKYNLHRQNDEWVATGIAQGAGMAPHGGTAPGANPHAGGVMGGLDQTPPSPSLPAGHPPIGKQP
jgi:hypothetical protein